MNKLRYYLKSFKVTPHDLLILVGLLATAGLLTVIFWVNSPDPKYVIITHNGNEVARLPLSDDIIYPISDGNVIEISDGTVRMIEADCPDKVCIHTGKISRGGQSIVCLPNRVVVTITSGDEYDDIITH